MVQVAAALIWREDRFLICQRPAHKARGLLWEFVGGKLEPGEDGKAALKRECREELDAEVTVGPVFNRLVHTYPDLTIELTLYYASMAGDYRLLEHKDAKWITTEEIGSYVFCPADESILEQLRAIPPQVHALRRALFSDSEEGYRAFQIKLIPTVAPELFLGVRTPALRRLAKKLPADQRQVFLKTLPHRFYEENCLHALLLEGEKDFETAVAEVDGFLPQIDNWAVCDVLSPKVFGKHKEALLPHIRRWVASEHEYTCRFGIEMLMTWYLEEAFVSQSARLVAQVNSDAYYVKMMQAWFFATALAKQWDAVWEYLSERKLPVWVHQKTIQKAVESYRITPAQKTALRALRR